MAQSPAWNIRRGGEGGIWSLAIALRTWREVSTAHAKAAHHASHSRTAINNPSAVPQEKDKAPYSPKTHHPQDSHPLPSWPQDYPSTPADVEEGIIGQKLLESGATDRWADTPSLAQASGEAALVHSLKMTFTPRFSAADKMACFSLSGISAQRTGNVTLKFSVNDSMDVFA